MKTTCALLLIAAAAFWPTMSAEARISHGDSGVLALDTITAVGDDQGQSGTALVASYPNPFNPRVTLEYELTAGGAVELAVFDLRGRLVRTLVAGEQAGGRHATAWDGQDAFGRAVAAGTYVCRLLTAQGHEARTLSLVR